MWGGSRSLPPLSSARMLFIPSSPLAVQPRVLTTCMRLPTYEALASTVGFLSRQHCRLKFHLTTVVLHSYLITIIAVLLSLTLTKIFLQ